MKLLIFSLALTLPVFAGSLTVCNAGCDYSTAQAALNASNNGDTIVLKAGQNLGPLVIPGNRHDLTIKSSEIDTYRRGYRITRSNPVLARLTTVTIGDSANWGTAPLGTSLLTNAPGFSVIPHGLKVGDQVTVGGRLYSTYVCAIVNQPPYVDGACDASRVGFMNIRADTRLGNGSVLYFKGRTLPPPLQINTPYYIVNFVRGGSAANADKFQIALTPGGSAIFIPRFNPVGQDLVVEAPPSPFRSGDSLYVVSTPTPTTLQLSPTPGGAPVVWTQLPYNYNGGGFSNGLSLTKISPVYNVTFDGIEVAPNSDNGVFYPFYVSRDIASFQGEHHNLRILRCWIHGADDQEDFPYTMVNIAARDIEIGWSIIENSYSTGNDTQNIGFISTANVSIHDNELKGATESIFSGGNYPWFALQTNTTGISVYRNYIWKPLKNYLGIIAVYVSPTQFQFLSRFQNADCSTVVSNPNLGARCFAYEAQETPGTATPPSAPLVSRTEWSANAASSTFTVTGAAGQVGYIYLLGGVFHMDYNFSGGVSCPSLVVCTRVASPSFSPASTRIGIAVIGPGGTFDGSFFAQNRNVWSKNLIESKYGDNWLVEGNVFHRQSNCDGGTTCQDPAIQFTIGINGSGTSDPVNYLVSSSNNIVRNNIFRMLSGGVNNVGKSFPGNVGGTGLNWEFTGFGKNVGSRVENNLFMDLGSTEYQPSNDGFIVAESGTQALTVQHNTAVDIRLGFTVNAATSSIFRSNLVTPYRDACTGYTGCANPAATSEIGVQDTPLVLPTVGGDSAGSWVAALANGNVDATSRLENNLLMNRMGVCCVTNRPANYPTTTWLMGPGDAGRDPNTLFTSWQERDNAVPPNGVIYRLANFRLAPGQAALYPAYDSRAIGADIDEIEALTGRAGVDVENGWPTFADRTARAISAGASSAIISYRSNGSACTIKAWANSFYSGTPAINTNDSSAANSRGIISLTLSGLAPDTAYYGKRLCGAEVDVFSFATVDSTPTATVQLAAPGGAANCDIDYGPTIALGSTTSAAAVTSGTCTVPIPSSAVFWRYSFLSSSGTLVARGNILQRAQ